MRVDYDQLSLAAQLLERQSRTHLAAAERYTRSRCELERGEMGLVLQALQPLNSAVVDLGAGILERLAGLLDAAAERTRGSLDDYVGAEAAAHAAAAKVAGRLELDVPAFADPRSTPPTLGPAGRAADAGYGGGSGDVFVDAADTGADLGWFVRTRGSEVVDRLGGLGGGAGVRERNDPSSYLVPPVAPSSEIGELRWSAGVVLGGMDWLFEQLFGYSLIADVIAKPLAGDWDRIEEASMAWTNAGRAGRELGGNLTGLVDALDGWQGAAAAACSTALAGLAGVFVAVESAFQTVSGIVHGVSVVAEESAKLITRQLKRIADKLLRMAAEAAVPVAGWIADAVEVVLLIQDIVSAVLKIHSVLQILLGAISDAIQAKERLTDLVLMVEDLAEAAGRRTAQAVTA